MQFFSILKRGKPRKFVFKEEKFSSRVESRDGKSIAMKARAERKWEVVWMKHFDFFVPATTIQDKATGMMVEMEK